MTPSMHDTTWKQRPSILRKVTDVISELPLADWFPTAQPLELELGCGDGTFLARHAERHCDRNFLGVERLFGRVKKLDKKARRAALTNIALLRFEAAYLVRYLIPARSLSAIHVYFPDPWPKKRHRSNRLIQPAFITDAARVLTEGGIFYLRTDDTDYFEQMLEVFEGDPGYQPVPTPETLKAMRTDFEVEFNQRGIPTLYAAYLKG
jgi:tRNA (guanine-N7-)-methyltransferase